MCDRFCWTKKIPLLLHFLLRGHVNESCGYGSSCSSVVFHIVNEALLLFSSALFLV